MLESQSPITKKIYKIPEVIDDSRGIKEFLSKNKNKKVVVVQGLGFVGAVMSIVCANALTEEYAVIGVDLAVPETFWKIKSINNGNFPLVADDPNIDVFFNRACEKDNLYATYDPIAYSFADVIVVDINLDVQKSSNTNFSLDSFDVDLRNFKSAISLIGRNMREDALLLVETTVPPGTCNKVIKPIVENELEKRELEKNKFKLGHSYERVMPGPEYINSIRNFPRVFSGINKKSSDATEAFLKTIIDTDKCNLTRLSNTNATEMAKVLENSYRAANIAFVVEWSRFAEEAGVDLFSIVNAIRVRDTHSNLMYPGVGVGGYCLTKDPLLASWSRTELFNGKDDLSVTTNSVSINDRMPKYAFERLEETFGSVAKKKITFLGISYRGDVGDTRLSPVKTFVDLAEKKGAATYFHDPFIDYWDEKETKIENNLDEILLINSDIIVISAGHSIYKKKNFIDKLLRIKPVFIFDTLGLFNDEQILDLKAVHKISILGRGDIK